MNIASNDGTKLQKKFYMGVLVESGGFPNRF